MKILLVDDEVELTDPLSRLLTREGYSVDATYDGTSGSNLAEKGNYDLLILDTLSREKNSCTIFDCKRYP
jgi:two-component system, OmpR family, manganese sensing response regulator